jgi:hypothetical protein
MLFRQDSRFSASQVYHTVVFVRTKVEGSLQQHTHVKKTAMVCGTKIQKAYGVACERPSWIWECRLVIIVLSQRFCFSNAEPIYSNVLNKPAFVCVQGKQSVRWRSRRPSVIGNLRQRNVFPDRTHFTVW